MMSTVELPDPLLAPLPADAAGTDELLSRMAGEEIDRLLAESNIELGAEDGALGEGGAALGRAATEAAGGGRFGVAVDDADLLPDEPPPMLWPAGGGIASTDKSSPAAGALAAPTGPERPPATGPIAPADADAAPTARPASDASGADASGASASALDSHLTSHLDRLVAQRAGNDAGVGGEAAPGEAAATTSAAAGAAGAAAGGEPAAPSANASPTPATEASIDAQAAPPAEAARDTDERSTGPSPLPAKGATGGSRLIAIIDRLLDPFPEPVRDVLGKIAVVTLINAAALLVYLLFFRR